MCGQVVVLRGLNLPINAKVPDFMPLKTPEALKDLQPLPLYGTSIARVLFTWEAFEPERGQYNMEYLDYYKNLVQASILIKGHHPGPNAHTPFLRPYAFNRPGKHNFTSCRVFIIHHPS